MVSAPALPPEIAAALEVLDPILPGESRRAAAALEIISDRCRFVRDRPYKSRLTGDGFPVELVFSSLDTADPIHLRCGWSRNTSKGTITMRLRPSERSRAVA